MNAVARYGVAKHYINNQQMLQAIIAWRAEIEQANIDNPPTPRIPDYLGECFMLIATRLATKPNFYSYTFKGDIVGQALLQCCISAHKFDPTKSSSAFAFFTQVCFNSFLRVLNDESAVAYRKLKLMEKAEREQPSHKRRNSVQEKNAETIARYEARLVRRKKTNDASEERTRWRAKAGEV